MAGKNHNGSDWFWQLEAGLFNLHLSDDAVFTTDFKSSQITSPHSSSIPFSAADAAVYVACRDVLKPLPLCQKSKFILAIYATISAHYAKPPALKSWLFSLIDECEQGPIGGLSFVSVEAESLGIYLVLESEGQTSKLILVSHRHLIDESLTLTQGHIVRVHNNRLSPVLYQIEEDML